MKKSLLVIAIVLPFLWFKPIAKAQSQPTKAPAVTTWNLPKEIITQIKSTVIYRGVSSWLNKILDL